MSDTPGTIFNQTSQETPGSNGGGNPPNVQTDAAITTMLAGIKNERGEQKYKTLDDALNALKHSQEFIPQLNQKLSEKDSELERLRAESNKINELERTLQSLTQQKTDTSTNVSPGMSAEEVANLVNLTLSKKQQEQLANDNLALVANAVQQSFGTEAEKVFYGKAQELGMTVQEFNALAAKNPKAVLSLVGVQNKAGTTAPVRSTVNAGGFTPPANTMIGSNKQGVPIGATFREMQTEWHNSKKMVEELEANGLSIDDMVNPKNYFKHF